jgi:DNA repair protein RecO (recombination protein O)
MAKSALKSKKRFGGGVLEPMHFVSVTYKTTGKNSSDESLKFLNEATLLNDFPKIREDYDKLALALHILKVIATATREGDVASKGLFDLTGNALRAIETSTNLAALRTHFEVKYLNLQGVLPVNETTHALLAANISDHSKLTTAQWTVVRNQLQPILDSYLN